MSDVDIKAADNLAVQCERLAIEVRKVTQDDDMSTMAEQYAEVMRAYVTMLQAQALEAVHSDVVKDDLAVGVLK